MHFFVYFIVLNIRIFLSLILYLEYYRNIKYCDNIRLLRILINIFSASDFLRLYRVFKHYFFCLQVFFICTLYNNFFLRVFTRVQIVYTVDFLNMVAWRWRHNYFQTTTYLSNLISSYIKLN